MRKLKRLRKKIKKLIDLRCKASVAELAAIKPLDPISPLEIINKIRIPPEENYSDRIDLGLTPYIKEPLECLQNYDIESIFIIGPTQSGKTVVAQGCVAWTIDQNPGPTLYTYPDENTAKTALGKKIVSMVRATPFLQKYLIEKWAVSKKSVKFHTMDIDIAWSNSPATMNVIPYKRVIGDEIRLFKLTIGKESNAIKLMQDRLTTYLEQGTAQGLFVSSPSTEGDLLHQQLDVPGTIVMLWHVPCPQCGEFQKLDFWENVRKPDRTDRMTSLKPVEKFKATCICKYCSSLFSDDDKKQSWNSKGVYAPEGAKINKNGTLKKPIVYKRRVVFWWDSLVSPFRSFDRIWNEYIETKDKIQDYKNFIQCWLARFWKDRISTSTTEQLKERCQTGHLISMVPEETQVLFTGIDTQDDSLYAVVYAAGNNQYWLVDEMRLLCDINTTTVEELIEIIGHNLLNKIYYTKDGKPWKIGVAAWDSGGHRTKDIYAAARKYPQVAAIKGMNTINRTVMWSKKETHYNIRTIEFLEETESLTTKEFFHLPTDVSTDFLVQYLNHTKIPEQNRKTGAIKYNWVSFGADHFRFASAYAFSGLWMQIKNIGILKTRLKDIKFSYNPCKNVVSIVQNNAKEKVEQPTYKKKSSFFNRPVRETKKKISSGFLGDMKNYL